MISLLSPNKKYGGIWLISALCFLGLLGTVNAVGTYPSVDPTMIFYAHMNNQSAFGENDTLVRDFSSSMNNATVIGGAIHNNTGGYLGDGSFDFNGSQYMNATIPVRTYPFTLSAWFWTNSSTEQLVIGLNNKSSSSIYYNMEVSSNKILLNSRNSTNLISVAGTTIIQNNTWYMFTISVENQTSARVYINGVFERTFLPNQTFNVDSVLLGTLRLVTPTNFLKGGVDEAIVYNRALSELEVINLYHTYHGCYVPTDQMNVSGNMSLCNGVYNLNSSGNVFGNGGLRIGYSNTLLNGNGAIIYGNGTGVGVSSSAFSNVSVSNLIVTNYSRGMYFVTADNVTLVNNTYHNSSQISILLRTATNSLINANFMYGINTASGIQLDTSSSNANITNNYMSGVGLGIDLWSGSSNGRITSNIITHGAGATGNGIYLQPNANSSYVFNNTIRNSGHNCIASASAFNTVINNSCYDAYHNSIDLFNSQGSNIIYLNYVNNTLGADAGNLGNGVFIKNSSNNNVSNNTIKSSGYCLSVYGNRTDTYNNRITNNSLSLCTYGILAGGNNTFANNTVYNSTTIDLEITSFSGLDDVSSFSGFQMDYVFRMNSSNMTAGSGTFIQNIYSLTSALIFNTTGSCTGGSANVPSNLGSVNITLPDNQRCTILNRYSVNQSASARLYDPIAVTNVSSNVRAITSSAGGTFTNVSVTLQTGGIVPSSPLLVHPDGSSEYPSYLYDSVGQTITFDASIQPGVNVLYLNQEAAVVNNVCSDVENSFGSAAAIMALVVLVLFGGFAIMTVYDFKNKEMTFDTKELINLTIGFLVTCIIIVIGAGIISVASGTC